MTRARITLAVALLASITGWSAPAPVSAAAPREHRVYMITDSVGLGAKYALPRAFPADWTVTIDGDAGEFVETLERRLVKPRHASNPEAFGDHAIVAAGYNYPFWDPDRFDRSVDSMIDTLTSYGVRHVYWVTLREVKPQFVSGAAWRQIQPYYWYFPEVNDHLEAALDRHSNLTLIDWAAVADRPGITYDAIHLNNEGAALYSELARSTVMTTATRVDEGSVTHIPIPDPDGVTAVALNLTTTRPRHRGFLTAYSCDDELPGVSNHNFVRDQTVAHATIVPLGPSGEVCVYASRATNLIVDLTGRFTGDVASGAATQRLVDTRPGGTPQPAFEPIVVDVAPGPATYTVTAIGATERGWVRVTPCGSDDDSSNVNMDGPDPTPNAAVLQPGDDGTLCIVSSTPVHILLDRLGALPGDALSVAPPRRIADTRPDEPLGADEVLRLTADDLGIDPATATTTTGVLLNLTGVNAAGTGFVTVYGCADGQPPTSNLNLGAGAAVANLIAVSPDSAGELCLHTTVTTDLVIDLQARTGEGFTGDATRLVDSRQ